LISRSPICLTINESALNFVTSPPGKVARYCDRRVCMLCLSVCLHVRSHISKITRPNFTKFSVHVTCGRDSVLIRRQCDSYVLPVLWMTSCFPVIERMGENQRRRGRMFRRVRQVATPVAKLPSRTASCCYLYFWSV